jgi:hypothetical protein
MKMVVIKKIQDQKLYGCPLCQKCMQKMVPILNFLLSHKVYFFSKGDEQWYHHVMSEHNFN